jgi:hypothetical protein
MNHAKSLRVIGQSLEVAKVQIFELETDGPNYVLTSDSLTGASEWILRHGLSANELEQSVRQSTVRRSVRFTAADILRLEQQAQKQRRMSSPPDAQAYKRLSQLLRTLGDHLDRTRISSFHIFWSPSSAIVQFQSLEDQNDSRTFTAEKLEQLGSHSRFRRSSGTRLDSSFLRPRK